MHRSSMVALGVLLAAAVRTGCDDSDGDAQGLPDGPAPCAGPIRAQDERMLAARWRLVRETSPGSVWIGASRPLMPAGALALTAGTELLAITYVLPERQGTYRTTTVEVRGPRDAATLTARVPKLSPLSLGTAPTAVTREAAAAFASGRIPVAGMRIQGSPGAVADVVRREPCAVYSLAPGSMQGPLVSATVNPAG